MTNGQAKKKVLILDGGMFLRERIANLIIKIHPDFEVISISAISMLTDSAVRNKPDVALLDIGMLNGSNEVIGQLKLKRPGITVILMGDEAGEIYRKCALKMGADGIVEKAALEKFIRHRLKEIIKAAPAMQ